MNEFVVSDDIYRKRAVASLAGVKITGCKDRILVKLTWHS